MCMSICVSVVSYELTHLGELNAHHTESSTANDSNGGALLDIEILQWIVHCDTAACVTRVSVCEFVGVVCGKPFTCIALVYTNAVEMVQQITS